jgi:hypothetical protein
MYKRILALVALSLAASATPAQAQYWGLPYGMGTSAYWPARSLFYPLRYMGATSSQPWYLANSLMGAAAYYGINRTIVPQMTTNRQLMAAQNYQDDEPVYDPRQRTRSYRPSKQTVDQNVHAQWLNPPPPAGLGYGNTGYPPVAAAPPVMPAPLLIAPSAPGNAPLAEGFVNLVNSKFNGDLVAALKDDHARSWAQTIGINTRSIIPQHRQAVLKTILSDQSLHPVDKIQAITSLTRN